MFNWSEVYLSEVTSYKIHILVDCQWGTWGSWGWCYGSCPSQSMKRQRSKIVIACGGGQDCQGSSSEVAPCQPNECEFLIYLTMLFRKDLKR